MSANIEHLRAVGRAATEGPWEVDNLGAPVIVRSTDGAILSTYEDGDCSVEMSGDDAEFCATARNEWDGMVNEIESLRRWKAEADPVLADLQELGRALGLPLGTPVTAPAAVEAAKALRETVARCRLVAEDHRGTIAGHDLDDALADEWARL